MKLFKFRKSLQGQASGGFTLVEVMITVLLAVLAIAAVGATLQSGAWMTSANRERLYALNGLRIQMEGMRNASFDAISNGANFANAETAKLNESVGLVTATNSFGPDIKRLTLTVTWRQKNGVVRSESITSLFTRRGINGQ